MDGTRDGGACRLDVAPESPQTHERLQDVSLADVLDSLGTGILTVDRELNVTSWNQWLEDRSGMPRGLVLGRHLPDLFPEIRERALERRIVEVLQTGAPAVLSPHFHGFLIRVQAGVEQREAGIAEMRQQVEIRPLRKDGRVTGAMVTLTDTTAYLLGEIQLKQANEKLTEINARLEAEVQKQVQEITRKRRLERFFSPRLVKTILERESDASLGAARKKLSILSCDLRGFTEVTDGMEPEEVTDVLSVLLREMADVIYRFEGTLDRFTGEGIRVFFGDPLPQPNHAERAVRVAFAMQERAVELNRLWAAGENRRLSMGIGINSGYVTVGPIGSETHLQYTAIGRHAALAGRLRDFAKGGETLVTHFTYGLVRDLVEVEELGPKSIQGFQEPVYLYRIARLLEPASASPSPLRSEDDEMKGH